MTPASVPDTLEAAFQDCCDLDASLNERLGAFAVSLRAFNAPISDAVDRLIARLREAGVGASAPKAGDPLPPFYLPDEAGRVVGLGQLLDKGPVAVIFHRGHWCPYRRINTRALAQAQPQVRAAGGQVVAIMPDRQQFAAALKSESQGEFPILTDLDNGYAMSLNLVFWVGRELEQLMADAGLNVPAYQGNSSWMIPVPATFVVGRDGLIKRRFVDPDYRKRMTIESMLEAFRS